MKRNFKFNIFLVIILTFFTLQIKAENKIKTNNKYFEEVIEEKLKVDIEEIQKLLKENPQQFILNAKKSQTENLIQVENNREVQVTSNTSPESELTAVINPKDTNNIIIAPIRQTTSSSNSLTVPIYYTKDFGKTWDVSNFAPLPPNQKIYTIGGGDPVCVFDNNGVAHLTWISLGMKLNNANTKIDSIITGLHYAYSNDGGATWNYDLYKSISLTSSYTNGQIDLSKLEFFDDKQWLAVDMNPTSQFYNNVYISFSRFENTTNGSADIRVSRKEKNSSKFSDKYINVSNGLGQVQQFSSNTVLSDGTLLVTFYSQSYNSQNSIFSAISTDGGNTFQTPVKITDFIFANSRLIPSSILDTIYGVDYSRLYPAIYCASDISANSKYKGYGYVAWSAFGITSKSQTGCDIYFAKTTNGGKSWSQPKIISNENGEQAYHQFYPSITVNVDGVIVMSWYEQGVNGNKSLANYVVSYSFDGGETFTKPIAANIVPTDFNTVGLKNNKFGIGEYNQIVATKNYAIPVWSDGRLNNGDLNIYAAFIPISDKTDVSLEKFSSINQNALQIIVTPNPANQYFKMHIFNNNVNQPVKYSLFDLQGNTILINQTLYQDVEIKTDNLKSGSYYIQAEQNGIKAVQKIIINK